MLLNYEALYLTEIFDSKGARTLIIEKLKRSIEKYKVGSRNVFQVLNIFTGSETDTSGG